MAAPQPAGAGERPVLPRHASGDSRPSFLGGLGGGLGGGAPAARASGTDDVGTTPEDFNTFERLLGEIQAAYSAEDLGQLRARATPEMVSYFAEDLAANASRGVVNPISDVKLLQGDLAEAWREGDTDYATVAMRFALNDQTIDRASGRVIEGGPEEATEVWTFMRCAAATGWCRQSSRRDASSDTTSIDAMAGLVPAICFWGLPLCAPRGFRPAFSRLPAELPRRRRCRKARATGLVRNAACRIG